MADELVYKQSIEIDAEPSKVWDALTNPEVTKRYMFGCEVISDWKIGGNIIWRGAADGVEYVTGKLVRFEPNSALAFTTFDPNAGYPDVPENHLTGEYILTDEDGKTTLNLSQGDFAKVENGQKRYDESISAWKMTLQTLKNLLEEKTNS